MGRELCLFHMIVSTRIQEDEGLHGGNGPTKEPDSGRENLEHMWSRMTVQ